MEGTARECTRSKWNVRVVVTDGVIAHDDTVVVDVHRDGLTEKRADVGHRNEGAWRAVVTRARQALSRMTFALRGTLTTVVADGIVGGDGLVAEAGLRIAGSLEMTFVRRRARVRRSRSALVTAANVSDRARVAVVARRAVVLRCAVAGRAAWGGGPVGQTHLEGPGLAAHVPEPDDLTVVVDRERRRDAPS